MTIVYKESNDMFRPMDVLLTSQELVRGVIKEALVTQTETCVDMCLDNGTSSVTREEVMRYLEDVKGFANNWLEDVVNDFRRTLIDELNSAEYTGSVTAIKYDLDGSVSDVDVAVEVSWKDS